MTPRKHSRGLLLFPTLATLATLVVGSTVGYSVGHAEGIFKNLQVLPKDTDKPTLKAAMKKQAKALGVECEYCHAEPDMAKDTPKKKIGREMMRLTDAINQETVKPDTKLAGGKDLQKALTFYKKNVAGKTPDKEVTCMTCHDGEEKPKAK